LRLAEALGEGQTLRLHPVQNVVAGAVQDAIDALDGITGQSLVQGLDDRYSARDRSLGQRDALLLGERGEPQAVLGEQRLIGRDKGFARAERGFRRRECGAFPAPDQFDEKIDAWGPRQSHAFVETSEAGKIDPSLLALWQTDTPVIAICPAGPARQRLRLPDKQGDDRSANGAETGNPDAQGRRQKGFLPDFRDAIKAA
jgi:hypothetical protein